MTKYTELKHQLGVTAGAGVETLNRFGLNTEASMAEDIDEMAEYSGHSGQRSRARHRRGHASEHRIHGRRLSEEVHRGDRRLYRPGCRVTRTSSRSTCTSRRSAGTTTFAVGRARKGTYALAHRRRSSRSRRSATDTTSSSFWRTTTRTGASDIIDAPHDQVDWSDRNEYFGMSPGAVAAGRSGR